MMLNQYKIFFMLFIVVFLFVEKDYSQEVQTSVDVVPSLDNDQKIKVEPLEGFADSSKIRAYSLEEIIRLAVENNRTLKRLKLSGESAKIYLEQAEYRFLPSAYISGGRAENTSVSLGQVEKTQKLNSSISFYRAIETGGGVSINMGNNTNESSANAGVVTYNSGVNIAVSQPLLRGRGITVNKVPIERAKNYAKASMLNVKQSLIYIITTIESRYWDLILVYKDLEIQKQALQRAKELLDINKSLIESGRMAAQEIVQAESDIASRDISVARAENAIISTQIGLQETLDLGEKLLILPTTEMDFQPVDISFDLCLERAYQNRPDWQIHNLYLEIEKMNLMVARNNNQYTLGSYASVGSDINSDHGMDKALRDALAFKELSLNMGLTFIFPFNKKVLENYYQLELLSLQRQEIYMEELKEDISIQIESAVRNVQFSLKQVSLATRAKELAGQKLELEEEKMKVGRSSNFQVISYQRDLTNAQNEELVRIAGYLKALGALEQTMGTTLEKWSVEVETVE